jgi:hypothetical protein
MPKAEHFMQIPEKNPDLAAFICNESDIHLTLYLVSIIIKRLIIKRGIYDEWTRSSKTAGNQKTAG